MRGEGRGEEREMGGWRSRVMGSHGNRRPNGRITWMREKGEEKWRDQGERVRSGHF